MNPYDETLKSLNQSQAGPVAAENPYDEVLRQQREAAGRRIRTNLVTSEGDSPEQAANELKLSRAIGLPADVVRRNYAQLSKQYDIDAIPFEQVQQSPALAEYMARGSAEASAVKDDLDGLSFLEWVVRAPQQSFARNVALIEMSKLSHASIMRELTVDERAALARWKEATTEGGNLGVGNSLARKAISGAAGLLPMIGASVVEGLERGIPFGVTAGTMAAMAGQMGPQVAAPEELVTVPVAFAGGMGAGMLTGSAEFGFQLESGLAYDEFLEFRDEAGQQIDPAAAKAAALGAGALASGFEAVGLGALARAIPGVNKMMGAAARKSVAVALRNPSVRAALVDAVKAYGGVLTAETSVEVAQRAATILAGEWSKSVSGVEGQSAGAIAGELGTEAAEAFTSFALMPLPGAALQTAGDFQRVQAVRSQSAFFEALGTGVTNSKTVQRMPAAAREILARATAGGPVENMYVDVEQWRTYWQDQGMDPAEVAATVTGSRDAYEQALQTAGDLVIPTAAYATTIAGTEHHKALSTDLRLDPDAMSQREADEFRAAEKEHAAEQERLAAEAEAQAAVDGPVQTIAAAIERELVDGGKVPGNVAKKYAALDASVFVRFAEKAGLDPVTFFEAYGLKVGREGTEGAPVVRTGVEAALAGGAGPAVGVNSPGRLLAALDEAAAEPGPEGLIPVPGSVAPEQVEALRQLGIVVDLEGPDGETVTGLAPEAIAALRTEAESATVPGDGGAAAAGAEPGTGDDVRSRLGEHVTAAQVRADADRRRAARAASRGVADIPASYGENFQQVLSAARSQGFEGTDDQLATIYTEYLADAERVVRDTAPEVDDVVSGRELLSAISGLGGLNIENDRGELKSTFESLRKKPARAEFVIKVGPRAGQTMKAVDLRRSAGLPGIPNIIVKGTAGLPADLMLSSLQQDERYEAMFDGNLSEFLEAVDQAVRAELETADRKKTGLGSQPIDQVSAAMSGLFKVRPDSDGAWWRDAFTRDPETGQTTFLQDELDLSGLGVDEDTLASMESRDADAFELNASGESSASLEALRRQAGMTARGEVFAVFNRFGQRRPLFGPDAVDYVAREGETYGVDSQRGFRVLDDRGGLVPRRDGIAEFSQQAFHGSPHKFDKFSLSAIGTGEGAQVYGWGLYFASRREIAEWYRRQLTRGVDPGGTELQLNGVDAYDETLRLNDPAAYPELSEAQRDRLTQGLYKLIEDVSTHVKQAQPGQTWQDAARVAYTSFIATAKAKLEESVMRQSSRDIVEGAIEGNESALAALDVYGERFTVLERERPGRTFMVEIPDPTNMLDWDNAVQPPAVREALERAGLVPARGTFPADLELMRRALREAQRVSIPEQSDGRPMTMDERWRITDGLTIFSTLMYRREAAKLNEGTAEEQAVSRQKLEQSEQLAADWWEVNHHLVEDFVNVPGETLYRNLTDGLRREAGVSYHEGQRLASEKLRAAGIMGIRYLDGSSRSSGDGSHNFVVFDDEQVQVVEFDQPLFHGSPHDFDRFSLDAIGTGEGAAAYGWGLYFAENPAIAAGYHDRLSSGAQLRSLRLGAMRIGPFNGFDYSRRASESTLENIRASLFEDLLIDEMSLRGAPNQQQYVLEVLDGKIEDYRQSGSDDGMVKAGLQLRAMLARPGGVQVEYDPATGGVYQVDVADAAVEKMLDWDAPLSKQPVAVQELVRQRLKDLKYLNPKDNGPRVLTSAWKAFVAERAGMSEGDSGSVIYSTLLAEGDGSQAIRRNPGGDQKAASLALLAVGVPGLRYLDADSREKKKGTRNVVVWDESIIELTHKDGKPVTKKERAAYLKELSQQASDVNVKTARDRAFTAWFGDSKVVDAEGKPLRVFHGTRAPDFTEFRAGTRAVNSWPAWLGDMGAWFTAPSLNQGNYDEGAAEDVAASFAERGKNDPLIGSDIRNWTTGSRLVPAFLSIKNPKEYDGWEELNDDRRVVRVGAASSRPQDEVARIRESGAELRERLIAEGYDGVVIRNSMTDGNTDRDDWIAFEPGQIKSATGNRGTFDPNSPSIVEQKGKRQTSSGRRGFFRIENDQAFTIGLTSKADLSTFLHESGHMFLEVFGDTVDLVSGLAVEDMSDEQKKLMADYETLLQWLGVKSRKEIGPEQHGQFAGGFEAYLMEGKAPSLEMREIFVSFRAWLIGVYRSFAGLVKAMSRETPGGFQLSDEVRAVFDRMIATDEAIAAARSQGSVEAMFATASDAGMTAAEFAVYQERVSAASTSEREALERKLLTEVQRERTAEWQAQREAIAASVRSDLEQRPVYQAMRAMRTGTKPDGSSMVEGEEPKPMKLSKTELVRRYGFDFVRRLPRPYVYTTGEDGMPVDTVAEQFGFTSGDELILAVREAPALEELIERETDRRMLVQHGSMLLDGSIEDKAKAAVTGEDRDHIIRQEIRTLRRMRREAAPAVAQALEESERERAYERRWFEAETKLRIAIAEGAKQNVIDKLRADLSGMKAQQRSGAARLREALPDPSVVAEVARARVAAMKVRALTPGRFWSAARKAAKTAIESAARGDLDGAIRAKQAELLNVAIYREVQRAREDVEVKARRVRELSSTAAQQRLGLAGESFLDQINGLLDRFSFAQVSQKSLDRRASLEKWVKAQTESGLSVNLPEGLLEEQRRTPFQELTVEEFSGVVEGIDQILHLARLKNRLLKAERDRTLAEVQAEIVERINEKFTGAKRRADAPRDRNTGVERSRMLGGWFASHRKMASLARQMDGHEDGGPMWEHVIRPINEAADREAVMNEQATIELGRLFEAAFPGREMADLYKRSFLPDVARSMSRMERITVALNWGNEGNRDRVRRGEKWTDQQVEAVLNTLSASDWQFVQGVWTFLEGYWSEIEAKQKRVTGLAPERVVPISYTTKYGTTVTGGYYPLKYDDRISAAAASNLDVSAAMAQLQAAYVQATTQRGHTEARRQTVSLPLRLDFGVMFEHVGQVIHDLSHHEMLIDVGRVMSKDVRQAILDTYGDTVYKQFSDGIRDVAFGDVPARHEVEQSLNYLRQGSTVAGLGWNLTTAFLQPLGLTQSVVRIGPKWVALGLMRWLRGGPAMEGTVVWIHERSSFMRLRGKTMQREINEIRNTVIDRTGAVSGWVDEALRTSTLNMVTKQGVADSFFYLIQKMQMIADVPTWLGAYEKAFATDPAMTEARAVALADQAVIDAQGGGQIKDLSRVQRGGPALKLWTNFYSFFNVTYNLTAESVSKVNRKDPATLGRFAVDYLLLFTVPAVLGYVVREALKPGDNPDDDDPVSLAVALAIQNASYMTGTMIGVRELSGAIQGFAGYEGPAGARAFASLSKFGAQAVQGEFDEQFFKTLNDAGGVLLHYPSGQVWRTLSGVKAMAEGRTLNPAALVTGAPRE